MAGKKSLLFIVIVLIARICVSQSDTTVYTFPDKKAAYPGGDSAMFSFISKNTTYPKLCVDSGIQGKVYVSCIVEKDGSLSDVKAVKKIHPELEKEATRVIKTLPFFNPATKGNEMVRSIITIPVVFKLSVVEKKAAEEWQHLRAITPVDSPPVFPGGIHTLEKYLDMIFEYPFTCKQLNIQGKSVVKFTVNKQGEVVEPAILKGVHFDLDNEAIRIVNMLPDFTPATINGSAVDCDMTLSINFVLECSADDFPFSGEDDLRLKYPGGFNAMMRTFFNNINYSKDILGFGQSGKSVISFEVDTNGEVRKEGVLLSGFAELEKEMFRSLHTLQKFKPGTIDRVKQTGRITIPVSYKVVQTAKGENELKFKTEFNFVRTSLLNEEYSFVDEMPEPDGRPLSDISRVLMKHLKLPPGEEKNAVKADVYVRCFVTDEGKIVNPRIYKGLSTALEAEAIRAIQEIKIVAPALRLGKPIGCEILVPVDFSNFIE